MLTVSANSIGCTDTIKTSCCPNRKSIPISLKLCYETGTSFAAPVVAGILGLVKSKFPDATPQNYTKTMLGRESGQFIYANNKNLIGKMGIGAINACGALGGCSGDASTKTGLNNFGNPYATNNLNGIGGKIGQVFPIIPLRGQTFVDNTAIKFLPAGCSSISIGGIITNNAFVPNSGQVIPSCASLGLQDSKIVYDSGNGNTENSIIATFFTGATSNDPSLSLASQDTIITGTANSSNLPTLSLSASSFLNNDFAELILPGCEYDTDNNIIGKITNNNFVPNTGYKIPKCVFGGSNSATLNFYRGSNFDFSQSIGVRTNFNAAATTSTSSSSTSNTLSFGTPIGVDYLDGVGGKIGSPSPIIALPGQTFTNGTDIKFIPAGCTDSTSILGKITNNAFIPDAGQNIPNCAIVGSQNANLKYSSTNTNIQLNVKTFFTSSSSSDPVLTPSVNSQFLSGLIGSIFPNITLGNTTFLPTDKAEFFLSGCFDIDMASIKGTISNNTFIPDIGIKIPSCALVGSQAGTLDVWRGDNFQFGQTIGILTNFTNLNNTQTNSSNLANQTIVGIASDNSNLSTLVAALTAADLLPAVSGTNKITVLAPTNDAFAKIPSATLALLLKPENKTVLQQILKYRQHGKFQG